LVLSFEAYGPEYGYENPGPARRVNLLAKLAPRYPVLIDVLAEELSHPEADQVLGLTRLWYTARYHDLALSRLRDLEMDTDPHERLTAADVYLSIGADSMGCSLALATAREHLEPSVVRRAASQLWLVGDVQNSVKLLECILSSKDLDWREYCRTARKLSDYGQEASAVAYIQTRLRDEPIELRHDQAFNAFLEYGFRILALEERQAILLSRCLSEEAQRHLENADVWGTTVVRGGPTPRTDY
jgi:hypothetical protein